VTKTNAGWFIMRTGKNPTNLIISGYMMDAKDVLEKHEFLENYKKYIEDTRNVRMEYVNPYAVKIRLEGRDYHGYIQSISFSKAAIQPYLYQYNLTFIILNDKMIYDARQAARSVNNINALINTGAQQNILTASSSGVAGTTGSTTGATPGTSTIYNTLTGLWETTITKAKTIGDEMYNQFKNLGNEMNKWLPVNLFPPSGKNNSGSNT
jgi:hypothetical protein